MKFFRQSRALLSLVANDIAVQREVGRFSLARTERQLREINVESLFNATEPRLRKLRLSIVQDGGGRVLASTVAFVWTGLIDITKNGLVWGAAAR